MTQRKRKTSDHVKKTASTRKKKIKLPKEVEGIVIYDDGSVNITSPAIRGRIALDLMDGMFAVLEKAILAESNPRSNRAQQLAAPWRRFMAEVVNPTDGEECRPLAGRSRFMTGRSRFMTGVVNPPDGEECRPRVSGG